MERGESSPALWPPRTQKKTTRAIAVVDSGGNLPALERIDGAFAKGAVLFDAGERYMVHASRREKPGMAEVHTFDADIVHVLEGMATVVTGGKAVHAKLSGPGEYRGSAIEGGS